MKQSDFYSGIGDYPFKRDIGDIKLHFRQRSLLLSRLGIIPVFIQGQKILEIGPGYGENALFLLAQSPALFTLVESSEECLAGAKELLEDYRQAAEIKTIVEYERTSIEEFCPKTLYDYVLFEGVIPFEPDPEVLFLETTRFVGPGGVLGITCIDPVSLFPEVLRRLVAIIVAPVENELEKRVEQLLPIFKPHLDTLGGMGRKPRDWVIDQMIHPWSGRSFSILEAAKAVSSKFELLGSSPQLFTDWSWFRELEQRRSVLDVEEQYFSNLHNFLDYRYTFPARDHEDNRKLLELCTDVLDSVRLLESSFDDELVAVILGKVTEVQYLLEHNSPETAESLKGLVNAVNLAMEGEVPSDFGSFASLFGRGQQHVSFIHTQ